MQKLTRKDLLSLEQYAERRPELRREVMAHKRHRHIALGEHVTLLFEDSKTVHYQIQEINFVTMILYVISSTFTFKKNY